MKITWLNVSDRDLDALLERVHQRAESLGVSREEGYREALRMWLGRFGDVEKDEPTSTILEGTQTELAALKAVLAAMRSYDR